MLTRSWGSYRTITTLMRPTNQMRSGECGVGNAECGICRRGRSPCDAHLYIPHSAFRTPHSIHSALRTPHSALLSSDHLQHPHPLRILPVAAQVNPPVATAPDELPRPAQSGRQHFVDDEVEADLPADVGALPVRPGERERDAISVRRAAPPAPDRFGRAGELSRAAHPQPAAVLSLGDHEESLH